MALAAYAQARPLHDQGATPRAMEAPSVALEGLKATTLSNATRYAREAAGAALEALMRGDKASAMHNLKRAKRWEAYALAVASIGG